MADKFSAAKLEISRQRRLAQKLVGKGGDRAGGLAKVRTGGVRTSHLRVHGIESRGMGNARLAVVSVAGASSGFYDPTVAFQKAVQDALDPKLQPAPVRVLGPSDVQSTALEDAKRSNRYRPMLAWRRMRKFFGYYVAAWPARGRKFSWFFLYADDTVRLQSWSHAEGWRVIRVPPDGLDSVA